jgi:hypothetical protein
MSKGGKKKQVRQSAQPFDGKSVRQSQNPEATDHQTVAWRISSFDWAGDWGDNALSGCDFKHLIRDWCHNFESQTWAELMRAAGGRAVGTNHHAIPIEGLSKIARKRLEDLKKDDLDSLFSFRIDGTTRLYGIRERRAFCALWYDPWHDDQDKAVCPSPKKHT